MKNKIKTEKLAIFFTAMIVLFSITDLLSQDSNLGDKIRDNDIKAVKEIIASGADINRQDETNGYTPLMIACYRNYEEMAEILISEGADLNHQGSKYGHTALIIACNFNYPEIAKLLISKGADINISGKDGSTALIAAGANSQEIVELLLSKGADINAKTSDGTGVFSQCIRGIFYEDVTLELAEILLSKGVNVDEAPTSETIKGYTSLILSTMNNKEELVRFLIKNGADVNAKTGNGSTALSLAEKMEYQNIIDILKSNGAK